MWFANCICDLRFRDPIEIHTASYCPLVINSFNEISCAHVLPLPTESSFLSRHLLWRMHLLAFFFAQFLELRAVFAIRLINALPWRFGAD